MNEEGLSEKVLEKMKRMTVPYADPTIEACLSSDDLTPQLFQYLIERGVRFEKLPDPLTLEDMRQIVRYVMNELHSREMPN